MDHSTLQHLAESNHWSAIAPELVLGGLALALLGLELLLPKKEHHLIPALAILGQLGVLLTVLFNFHAVADQANPPIFGALLQHDAQDHAVWIGGLLQPDRLGQLMRVFFLLTSILVSLLAMIALARQRVPKTEFYHIVLVITAALMLLVQSHNFVLLFVALETVTVGFYILVSYTRDNARSLEAGLKYLILGSLSSGLLLFGIVLLYGAAGNPALAAHVPDPMSFDGLHSFLLNDPDHGGFLAAVGIVLVLAGIAFKIGAVPFQIWIPDVYQGAPTPVTAFLAVGSKAAGFAVLLKVAAVFSPNLTLVTSVLSAMAVATILFGNLSALGQTNVKRLMGLSGVSHAGYLLIGVIAAFHQPLAVGAVVFYLFAYLLASFTVFGVMAHLAGPDDADQPLESYAGLAQRSPFLATLLVIGLGSLAGIPPLAGFLGKLLIFVAAFKAGLYWLLAVAVVGVVISIYYYFGWIMTAFFKDSLPPMPGIEDPLNSAPPPPLNIGLVAGIALALLATGSVLFGCYQGVLGEMLGLR